MSSERTLPHDWFPRPLPANIIIGDRAWCYSSFAFIHYRSRRRCGVRIGNDSGIYNGTFFDLGPEGQVQVGNYCTIVGAIISSNGNVAIGDYTFIAHQVVIADHPAATPWIQADCHLPARRGRGPDIRIGANAWIGARAVLLGGAQIGNGAIVGAAAVVDFEVPNYTVVAGNPARVVSKLPR